MKKSITSGNQHDDNLKDEVTSMSNYETYDSRDLPETGFIDMYGNFIPKQGGCQWLKKTTK